MRSLSSFSSFTYFPSGIGSPFTKVPFELFKSFTTNTLLAPYARSGWLPAAISEKKKFSRFDVVCLNPAAEWIKETFTNPDDYMIHIGKPSEILHNLKANLVS